MTDMKRLSVSLTDEIVERIEALKATDEYKRMPYSAIIRKLILAGLPAHENK